MNIAGYDQALRRRIDSMLQLRAAIGGNAFALLMIWDAAGTGRFWIVVAICVTFLIFASVMGRRVYGMMDRRLANVSFFLGSTAYALGIMWACNFEPPSLFIVPVVILIYDGFGEGESRPFIVAMLAIFAVVPLVVGAVPARVGAAVGLGALIHWFSEGRALVLRETIADLRARRSELEVSCETLRRTQQQLVQSEKMAAIGQLAAGVAHEINNPLGVILGFAQGMDRRVAAGDALRLPVSSIVREAMRCKALVEELLVFSRSQNENRETVDLDHIVRASAVLLGARARMQNIEIVQELGGLPPIDGCNRTQLEQVIVNIGTNALDAMPSGGVLTLRTRACGSDEIVLEVSDTGAGIPAEVLPRIFEPFFTTKEVGKGTGLGLSIVYEIVQRHDGSIEITSDRGGTTIHVRLRRPIARTHAPTDEWGDRHARAS